MATVRHTTITWYSPGAATWKAACPEFGLTATGYCETEALHALTPSIIAAIAALPGYPFTNSETSHCASASGPGVADLEAGIYPTRYSPVVVP